MKNDELILKASPLPSKTWNFLKINDTDIPVPKKIKSENECSVKCLPENIKLLRTDANEALKIFKGEKISGALGENVEKWLSDQNLKCMFFTVEASKSGRDLENSDAEKRGGKANGLTGLNAAGADPARPGGKDILPAHITIELKAEEKHASLFVIHAKKGTNSRFIFECRQNTNFSNTGEGFLAVFVLCCLEENSALEISKIQFLGQKTAYLSDIGALEKRDSKLTLIRGNFGAEKSWLGSKTSLKGDGAEIESKLAYMTDDSQTLDINDIGIHYGKRTVSGFNSQGVMLGKSYKNYKGTIDFIKGCSSSSGEEKEDVLLLSDDIINKSTPVILCDEEDVTGNHGATLGKIDENLLFYMGSRGLDGQSAKRLIANGKLYNIINRIPSKEIIEKTVSHIDTTF
ncbi:SufD family Fe-S cluster assembly protein [Treponema parvum]|uniref:SufD family Fe-S cluster assembly protein n=1 Tax=Treponema parvum TaxID=138851 RepID=A0A975EZC4_9SPIR|nr:SufD family Fe-S cluster assembly protein [Treponema parvum]QTQ11601.1 SufD family Fe-S cluster assembly protein [Treponema parvum]